MRQLNFVISTLLFITHFSLGKSQEMLGQYSDAIADCSGAAEVTNFFYPSVVQFPGTPGNYRDFMTLYPNAVEKNSVWIKLIPKVKGEFRIEIAPEDFGGDLSYFVFKDNSKDFCEKFNAAYIKPEKYVLQGKLAKNKKSTGTVDFSPSFKTDFQDVFYLFLHSSNKEKSIVKLSYSREGEIEEEPIRVQDYRTEKIEPYLHIQIRDKETKQPITANVAITQGTRKNALYLGSDFYFDLKKNTQMDIQSNTKGYFVHAKSYRLGEVKDGVIHIELDPLAPGKRLNMKDIKFEQGTDVFTAKSMPALKQLQDFLALNNQVRIEIQGHVNAPDMDDKFSTKKLSKKRAKAVYKYLKQNGIEKKRLKKKGYGNTEMIFEEPKNQEEEAANRRVEILILDL